MNIGNNDWDIEGFKMRFARASVLQKTNHESSNFYLNCKKIVITCFWRIVCFLMRNWHIPYPRYRPRLRYIQRMFSVIRC
jgi:hypothetical protein